MMNSARAQAITACCVLLLAASVACGEVVFSGTLDPTLNSNLTYWDQLANTYTPPLNGPTDWERSFNIAVHSFSVAANGPVHFASYGYGSGGFDAVVSVFEGVGDSAAYGYHEYAPLFPADFEFVLPLGPGTYTLAVSMFGSQPCAPGLCTASVGVFGDGFTNLVNYDSSRSLLYQVVVNEVPEASTTLMVPAGVLALLTAGRFRARRSHKRQ